MTDITCIGCLHGHFPKLDGGDLLIVTGDLTANDQEDEYYKFNIWLCQQEYNKKIVIAGNHDVLLQEDSFQYLEGYPAFEYLCDSGTTYARWPKLTKDSTKVYHRQDLRIWGSPWTKTFPGINLKCKAFTVDTEEELAQKWAMIPADTDILITHGPLYGIRDKNHNGELCGSKSLLTHVAQIKPRLHVFSHIHEEGGKETDITWKNGTKFVNCSIMNERYQPVNKPVKVIL